MSGLRPLVDLPRALDRPIWPQKMLLQSDMVCSSLLPYSSPGIYQQAKLSELVVKYKAWPCVGVCDGSIVGKSMRVDALCDFAHCCVHDLFGDTFFG